jgi:hypothetical protein
VTQQAKKKGGNKQPQSLAVTPDQDAAIAAIQQEAADLQRAAAEKQRAVAALRAQTSEQAQEAAKAQDNAPQVVSATVVKKNKRPGRQQRAKAKRAREAEAEEQNDGSVNLGSVTKAPKTDVDQHVTGSTYAQRAVSLRMAQPVIAVFANSGAPLCIARVATETLYYMYGNLLPTGKRYRVEHSLVCMTVKYLYKCGYLYRDTRARYARTDKNLVCAQDEELKNKAMTTSTVATKMNSLSKPADGSIAKNEHEDDEWEKFEPSPTSLEQYVFKIS